MQIVIPPGQGLDVASVSLSRAEASGLRTALNLMLSTGSSAHAYISWGDYETDITLMLAPDTGSHRPSDEATGGLS